MIKYVDKISYYFTQNETLILKKKTSKFSLKIATSKLIGLRPVFKGEI